MKERDMVDILTWIQGYDRRTIGKMDVLTWTAVATRERWTTDEAKDAVDTWYARNSTWITPANVNEIIRGRRRDAQDREDAQKRAISRGARPRPVRALMARIGRLPADEQSQESNEPAPLSVGCRHCGAKPYASCVRRAFRGGRVRLTPCPPHPSRQEDLARASGLIP